MPNEAFASQILSFIQQLTNDDSKYQIDDWKTSMNPIQFGVLSWTLGAFYWSERF